jgi:hypothetical protein
METSSRASLLNMRMADGMALSTATMSEISFHCPRVDLDCDQFASLI